MDILHFGIEVISVSAPGVLSPGPLFLANLACSTRRDRWSGIKVAYGHTIVEFFLIILLSASLFSYDAAKKYSAVIGFIGGVAILAFAVSLLVSIAKTRRESNAGHLAGIKSPFIVGLLLTALNPFFLLWWFTAGLKLIVDSAEFGTATGVVILFALHIWMDYVWLALTAYLASKGSQVLNSRYYRVVLFGLATVLIYYGIRYVLFAAS